MKLKYFYVKFILYFFENIILIIFTILHQLLIVLCPPPYPPILVNSFRFILLFYFFGPIEAYLSCLNSLKCKLNSWKYYQTHVSWLYRKPFLPLPASLCSKSFSASGRPCACLSQFERCLAWVVYIMYKMSWSLWVHMSSFSFWSQKNAVSLSSLRNSAFSSHSHFLFHREPEPWRENCVM